MNVALHARGEPTAALHVLSVCTAGGGLDQRASLGRTRAVRSVTALARYPIPLELVEALASPTGLALMVRARMRWAQFRPVAHVSARAGRYVAEIDFAEPIGPERQDGLVVMLTVMPDPSRGRPIGESEPLRVVAGE